MTRVLVAAQAVADLAELEQSHGLPPDTRRRVRRSLQPLGRLPLMGRALGGRWDGARYLLGPWPWMLLIYDFHAEEDLVVVLTVHDGRSSTAATPAP